MLDCFFAAPSQPLGEMEEIVIDFGDASTQIFHVGEGSVAVPGLVAGLEEAHRLFGSIPWPELVQPAIELAHAGLDATDEQRFLHTILSGILERDEGGRRIYGISGGSRRPSSSPRSSSARHRLGCRWPSCCPSWPATSPATRSPPEPLRTSIGGRTS